MGSREVPGYCSFTKAIEHLGDRWSLLIVRQLGVFGPLGFNELTRALPGRISRSVLTERLRRLETLGLVCARGSTGYRLTTVGAGLMPVLGRPARLGRDVASRRPGHDGARSRRRARVVGPAGRAAAPARRARGAGALAARARAALLAGAAGRRRAVRVPDRSAAGRRPLRVRAVCARDAARPGARPAGLAGALADGSLTTAGAQDLRRRAPTWFAPLVEPGPVGRGRPGADRGPVRADLAA